MTVLLTARHDGGENQANILAAPGQQTRGLVPDAGSRHQDHPRRFVRRRNLSVTHVLIL